MKRKIVKNQHVFDWKVLKAKIVSSSRFVMVHNIGQRCWGLAIPGWDWFGEAMEPSAGEQWACTIVVIGSMLIGNTSTSLTVYE